MAKRPGAVPAETKECILQAARDEFAGRGFQGSSLRRICSAAGVTTGALYFFFDGKDDLFETILSGVTVPLMDFMREHHASEFSFLIRDSAKTEFADTDFLIDFYFKNRQVCDILLHHPNHPAVERFVQESVDCAVEHYTRLLALSGPRETPVDRFDLDQFVHMQLNAVVTLVSHNFTREEMAAHSKTAAKMLRGAFCALLDS